MRYSGWYRRFLPPGVTAQAHNLGRKLLGLLQTRRAIGPVRTLSITRTLPDGSIVSAGFNLEQPWIEVIPGPGVDLGKDCTMAMESGVLYLGEPTSQEPFELPEFDEFTLPTRCSGTLWSCSTEALPTDRVRVERRGRQFRMSGGCTDLSGGCVESHVCDAAEVGAIAASMADKKRAQAVLPASMWTGMMQRYVQALYGRATAAYRLSVVDADATPKLDDWSQLELPIRGSDDATYLASWGMEDGGGVGIVDFGGLSLWLCRMDCERALFRPLRFNGCAQLVLAAARLEPATSPLRGVMVTFALAGALPAADEDEIEVPFDSELPGKSPSRYSWAWNDAGTEACVVLFDKDGGPPTATLYTATPARDALGTISVTIVEVEQVVADFWNRFESIPRVYGPRNSNLGIVSYLDSSVSSPIVSNRLENPSAFDAPVHAYYEWDRTDPDAPFEVRRVIRALHESATSSDASDETECLVGPVVEGSATRGPIVSQLDVSDGRCDSYTLYDRLSAASGFYGDGWSDVALHSYAAVDGEQYSAGAVCIDSVTGPTTDVVTTEEETFAFSRCQGAPTEVECDYCVQSEPFTCMECTEDEFGVPMDCTFESTRNSYEVVHHDVSQNDDGQYPADLIVCNGSLRYPVSRRFTVADLKSISAKQITSTGVVSATGSVSCSGGECASTSSGTSCYAALAADGDVAENPFLPVPSTRDVETVQAKVGTDALTSGIIVGAERIELEDHAGSIKHVAIGSFGNFGSWGCGCGDVDLSDTSDGDHEPLFFTNSGTPAQFRFTIANGDVAYRCTSGAQGGSYAVLNDSRFITWAHDGSQYVDIPPWPLATSHDLPDDAGAYASFIGWA